MHIAQLFDIVNKYSVKTNLKSTTNVEQLLSEISKTNVRSSSVVCSRIDQNILTLSAMLEYSF